jgi:hypothetical protein
MTEIVVDPSVTTGPIVGRTKIYVDGVPFRRVTLSNGEYLDLYDTSGPVHGSACSDRFAQGPALTPECGTR